ncbi:MAG: type VI secretion system baseplate subunit TssF [Burkholderiaceae bacterium]
MDPRLLGYYRQELLHIRDAAAEFAREHPKVAARLALDTTSAGGECVDPYVERLLEGFAFLAARVHFQQDSEYARFTQYLLELVYPGYLAPTPSMMIAQFEPDLDDPSLAAGPAVARGSVMSSRLQPGERTACRFTTGQSVRLWPLRIAQARFQSHVTDVPSAALAGVASPNACLRLRFKVGGSLMAHQLDLDELVLHLAGDDGIAHRVYEQFFARCRAVAVVEPQKRHALAGVLGVDALQPGGFDDEEALLPVMDRALSGYRLLKEYAAFPARYLFARIKGLRESLSRITTSEFELLFVTDRSDVTLEKSLDSTGFALHCTPAINLFRKRADRVEINSRDHEFHVISDRARPIDYEVFALLSVAGIDKSGVTQVREFKPLYARYDDAGVDSYAYYSTRRVQRVVSEAARQRGPRSGYIGTEVYVTLADPKTAPWPASVVQLAVDTLCSNRDLPLTLTVGGANDFFLEENTPVKGVRCIRGPTRPITPIGEGQAPWRALSHLSLNYLSLIDSEGKGGAASLRELLSLYGLDELSPLHKQLEGLVSVHSEAAISRVPVKGPIVFGRGTKIKLTMDERAFEGTGIVVLGAVLERFIARYASMNSFTQLVLASQTRGVIKTWPPRIGSRSVL